MAPTQKPEEPNKIARCDERRGITTPTLTGTAPDGADFRSPSGVSSDHPSPSPPLVSSSPALILLEEGTPLRRPRPCKSHTVCTADPLERSLRPSSFPYGETGRNGQDTPPRPVSP